MPSLAVCSAGADSQSTTMLCSNEGASMSAGLPLSMGPVAARKGEEHVITALHRL